MHGDRFGVKANEQYIPYFYRGTLVGHGVHNERATKFDSNIGERREWQLNSRWKRCHLLLDFQFVQKRHRTQLSQIYVASLLAPTIQALELAMDIVMSL